MGSAKRGRRGRAYEDAQRFASFRAAAALRLGEMLARDGDLDEAERHLSEAVRAAPDDVRAIEELVAVKIASGKVEEGKTLARQGIALFPLSYLLSEELGEPNLKQLANDTIRVLNLAAQYMRLGLYQRALTVLSRDYPSPQLDQTEPGALVARQTPDDCVLPRLLPRASRTIGSI